MNLGGLAGLGAIVGGADEYQRKQQQAQYQRFLIQAEQQRLAQQAQQLQMQNEQYQQGQQGLGAAFGALGQLGGGGQGGQAQPMPQQAPQQMAPQQTAQMPQAPSGMSWGGAAQAAPIVRQAESANNYNVGYGGADLSNAPKDATGFPQWAGKMGPKGLSHASGAYQFQPAEWKKYAGGLGVTDFSPQSQDKVFNAAYQAEGMKPWAANPKLAPLVGEAKQTSTAVTQAVPQQQWGRSSVADLAKAVEQANPGATPQVKMLALLQLQKLMAPDEKVQLQLWAQQNKDQLKLAMDETLAQFKQNIKPEQGDKFQFLQTPQGIVRASPSSGKVEPVEGLPQGTTKIGSPGQTADASIPPETLKEMASQYIAGDRTVMQNIGRGIQGSKNIVALRGEIAKQLAESGMSGKDMATKLAEFEGTKAGERTLGTRTANIEMAVTEAQQLIPLALEASAKVDRSSFPLLNNVILAGEKGTGDENVVRFGIAVNSLINVYARAISPTGVPTVNDKQHARELLSTAWSQGQFEAGMDQLNKELQAARKSPGMVREEFRGGQPQSQGGTYSVGQVIDKGGKKYRVTGGDPNDPDVEEVK